MDIAISISEHFYDTELNEVSFAIVRINKNFDVVVDITASQTDMSPNCWSIVFTTDPKNWVYTKYSVLHL